MPIIVIVIAFVILIKVFFLPAFSSGRKKQNQTVIASVLGKREEFLHNPTGLYSLYYVTFTFGENEKIELKTTKSEYKSLNYKDKVELTHKGEKLVSFTVLEKSNEQSKGETKHVASTMRSSLNELAQKKREE
ncbi:MAG: DUF2500 family protein [Clostridia bacterium]|nr:DUF2500 family protein [Clostridia bacterium]